MGVAEDENIICCYVEQKSWSLLDVGRYVYQFADQITEVWQDGCLICDLELVVCHGVVKF